MVTAGAYVLQFGNCLVSGVNVLLAGLPTGTILTDLGFPGLCGTPNVLVVDANGVPQEDVQFAEDDLVFYCPVTIITEQDGDGGG